MTKHLVASTILQPYGYHLKMVHTREGWEELRRMYGEDQLPEDPSSGGRTDYLEHTATKAQHFVVWISPDRGFHPHQLRVLQTIAHEAYHVADGLMKHIGQERPDNDEATAYLMDYIFGWMAGRIYPELRRSR